MGIVEHLRSKRSTVVSTTEAVEQELLAVKNVTLKKPSTRRSLAKRTRGAFKEALSMLSAPFVKTRFGTVVLPEAGSDSLTQVLPFTSKNITSPKEDTPALLCTRRATSE